MRRAPSLALTLALLSVPVAAAAETPETPPAPAPPADAPPPAAPPPAAPPPATPPPAAPPQQQPYPQQPYPQQQPPHPIYGQQGYPQQGYPPGVAPPPPMYGPQPGYPQQGYPPGYGYVPEPPPAPPKQPTSLRWSLRFDPFDLVMRQLTFQGEVYVAGPFAIEIAPSWIFGSPYAGIDKKGISIAGNAVFYLSGIGLRGFWIKAHFAYENYSATLTHPDAPELVNKPQRFSSAILGAMFGDTFVIPKSGGFALSAGIGVGFATAGKTMLTVAGDPKRNLPDATTTLYDGFDKVRLLGSLGLGVAF